MHTWRVHSYGDYRDVLVWEDCPAPTAPRAGVVLQVNRAALNFPDLLSIAGTYQAKAPLPFVPGMEAVGTVVDTGADSKLRVGDRVVANHLWGAFAERMAVLDAHTFHVPPQMPDAAAAAFVITYNTSYFGLIHRGQLQNGETVLVHAGAGGVGSAAIQIAKAHGARVIATAGSDAKLEICRQAGADEAINYTTDDFVPAVKRFTAGRGADVVYDPVGGDVFTRSTKCTAVGGRLVVIGFASGQIPSIAVNRLLLKNIAVVGLVWASYRMYEPELAAQAHTELCAMYTRGDVSPVIYREYPLPQLPAALAALAGRDSYGKILLSPS